MSTDNIWRRSGYKSSEDRPQRGRPLRERVSFGIACCRIVNNRTEILFVCKRYTYNYNLFVHGKYSSTNNAEIISLLNGMTVEEKIDLLSLNFVQIWYKIWLNNTPRNASYFVAKNKFETTFVTDGGNRLKKLIARSTHVNKIWEIPKGRRGKSELDIHAAIREFREETGIPKIRSRRGIIDSCYKMYPKPYIYSYTDANIKYTNVYYIAKSNGHLDPQINFDRQEQIDEICDIRWIGVEEMRRINPSINYTGLFKRARALLRTTP